MEVLPPGSEPSMKQKDKQHLLEIYHKSLEQYGDAAEAVHWREVSQRYRFKVLTEIAPLETASVLDYGCGKGDLYRYLIEAGFRGSYTGFDINPELVALGRSKFPGTRLEVRDIEQNGIQERFEYVLISGVFNNRVSDNWGMMRGVLKNAFACATKGLAFNAISTYVNFEDPKMFYASPEETFGFCMTQLSPNVVLRHDNLPHNFAIYVYRRLEWRP
jgi:SAM-dependent methyltransferase